MASKPGVASFKKLSRGQVIALAVVVALAGFNVSIPAGRSLGGNWNFALTHPTILLHIVAAAIVLVAAVVALIWAIRAGDGFLIALSIIGLAFVVLAFITGVDYVGTLRKDALTYMSVGWVGAIVAYGIGWYVSRRKERQEEGSLLPGD
jgi:hypothetical protein